MILTGAALYFRDAAEIGVERATYEVPFPPSTHGLFRNGRFKGDLSAKYRAWRDEAGWMLKAQGIKRFGGRVAVRVCLRAPDKRLRDADNYAKGPLDLLVKFGVIIADDNRYLRRSTVDWVDSGAACTIEIQEITA